jgi:signal transduction histidine kinase
MLAAMSSARPGNASLAGAALGLVGGGASADELAERFAAQGAQLRSGLAGELLDDLAGLGLVRVARGTGRERLYVTTSLGQQLVEEGLGGAASVRLEELESLRTDLLSTIAHELRTPLTAVRTGAGLLLDPSSDPDDEQRRTLLQTIERNAERMQRLVADILDLSRFRSGAIRLQLRPFDATHLARSAVATIAPLAEKRGQHVALDVPRGAGPTVFGDHRRLEQALLNLVSNAQRFAPDGGRVDVRVRDDGDAVRWSVTDDGPGIPAADQARLFERFFVGRNDRNAAGEGVGLGLPTALAIAQAHGGTIEVQSTPGGGSTFGLVVPLSGPPEDRSEDH